MAEVTYTLVCDDKSYGTITRNDLHQGRLWSRIGPALYMAVVKANKHAAELYYDDQKEGEWFSKYERSQSLIALLHELNKAISLLED